MHEQSPCDEKISKPVFNNIVGYFKKHRFLHFFLQMLLLRPPILQLSGFTKTDSNRAVLCEVFAVS
ncbi:hypothetical protein C4F51_10815 [Cellvibrio sp. KB43]|uniref:Uncharacterized protein n=1 Tax=Cellvibrio polysaccharolyticus TaxID=2082724 RepID=A0A928YU50_9GAMM|nr:hypothetical protein [Cellvibrio polysaccharolyticus]